MTGLLFSLLMPVVIVLAIIGFFVHRAFMFKEILENGVEVQAVIVQKRALRGHGKSGRQKKIVYRYTDAAGVTHENTSVVMDSIYDAHDEGGPFPVVYSSKNPARSGPKYLVDLMRQAK